MDEKSGSEAFFRFGFGLKSPERPARASLRDPRVLGYDSFALALPGERQARSGSGRFFSLPLEDL
jgi:hypothetical protein